MIGMRAMGWGGGGGARGLEVRCRVVGMRAMWVGLLEGRTKTIIVREIIFLSFQEFIFLKKLA